MLASAKINLDLRVTGRRDDGYHLLDSIVVFSQYGDQLEAEICDHLSLEITGPFGDSLSNDSNNLILNAARLICDEAGVEPLLKFHLCKNLPVSSGIGGGSADAAAAMLLTCELLSLDIPEKRLLEIALELGADVPVCLLSRSVNMCGIGDELEGIRLGNECHILLVNPGVSVLTPAVFKEYALSSNDFDEKRLLPNDLIHLPLMIELLKGSQNSLERAACKIEPVISEVLDALSGTEEVLLSRMSGSGATCFGLFKTKEQCARAAKKLQALENNWWIHQTKIKD